MKKILIYGLLVIATIFFLLVAFYFLFPKTLFNIMTNSMRRSADLVKKEVQIDNHRIVYLEGGKGETVILVHGFGLNKDAAWTIFAKYMKGYHLIIPDVPGFGESSQVKTDSYDTKSQEKRIDRFTEVLHLDKFHMAGQSMGGELAATYAAKHPEKVLTLTLLDTAGVPSKKKSEFVKQLEQGKNLFFADNAKSYKEMLALVYVKTPPIPAQFMKILVADMSAHSEFNKKIWKDWQPLQFSLPPSLPLIQAPVLIIWGEQDKITDIGCVAFLEKNLKNCRTVIIKDSGHAPMMEKPEETAMAYLSFLKEKR